MKQWINIGIIAFTLITGFNASAQEPDNVSNRYGPPNYTGGTINTPSESFAAAQVYEQQAEIPTAIESVYPNPTRANAAIVLQTMSAAPVSVYITNMNGVILKTYNYNAGHNSYNFDMANLPAGVYSIQVQERGKSMQSIQILKQE